MTEHYNLVKVSGNPGNGKGLSISSLGVGSGGEVVVVVAMTNVGHLSMDKTLGKYQQRKQVSV